jgi:hypothetical protein
MPRQKSDGPTRQIFANIKEDLYIKVKSKAAEQRLSMRDIIEKSLSLYLNIPIGQDLAFDNIKDSIWNDSNISIKVEEPIGSPLNFSEEEARRIAREAFE